MLNLKSKTPDSWIELVNLHLPELLNDHAHCEQKASASAISLINSYPDKDSLVDMLHELAIEEMDHYSQCLTLLRQKKWRLTRMLQDDYVGELRKLMRKSNEQELFIDRLLINGIIEARSCERFDILRKKCIDPELQLFYDSLFASEARHYASFVSIACEYVPKETVMSRLDNLLMSEKEIVERLEIRPRMH